MLKYTKINALLITTLFFHGLMNGAARQAPTVHNQPATTAAPAPTTPTTATSGTSQLDPAMFAGLDPAMVSGANNLLAVMSVLFNPAAVAKLTPAQVSELRAKYAQFIAEAQAYHAAHPDTTSTTTK